MDKRKKMKEHIVKCAVEVDNCLLSAADDLKEDPSNSARMIEDALDLLSDLHISIEEFVDEIDEEGQD